MNLADDDFTLFGLPRRFAQDRAEIEARWKQLAAEVHPDRHVTQGAAAQRQAMQWALRVNEAHQRLRDPLKRAAYLCELQGVPLREHDNTSMPAQFLTEQMQWREALEEASDAAAVEQLDAEVLRREQALLDEIRQLLDERQDVTAAAQRVRGLMFVHRFRDDIARRLDALDCF